MRELDTRRLWVLRCTVLIPTDRLRSEVNGEQPWSEMKPPGCDDMNARWSSNDSCRLGRGATTPAVPKRVVVKQRQLSAGPWGDHSGSVGVPPLSLWCLIGGLQHTHQRWLQMRATVQQSWASGRCRAAPVILAMLCRLDLGAETWLRAGPSFFSLLWSLTSCSAHSGTLYR